MWYQIQDQQVSLRLLVKPNAKKTMIIGADAQGLHMALHAKPIAGEANKVLINYLAEQLGLPKKQVQLRRGINSRYKQVLLPFNERVQRWLNALSTL